MALNNLHIPNFMRYKNKKFLNSFKTANLLLSIFSFRSIVPNRSSRNHRGSKCHEEEAEIEDQNRYRPEQVDETKVEESDDVSYYDHGTSKP